MKRIHLFALLTLSLLMFSCKEKSGNDGIKSMELMTEKINGPLGDYFKAVQDKYMAEDGQVTIRFKRVKEGWPVPMKFNAQMGYCDECYEVGLMAEFMDQDGNVLDKSLSDYLTARTQLEDLMRLDLNETGSVTFDVDPKGVTRIKLLSDFEYRGTATSNLKGAVNGIDILMSLDFTSQGEAKGAYYHRQDGPDATLLLKGQLVDQKLTLNEYSKEGEKIGKFKGVFKDGIYTGDYEAFDGRTYELKLREDPVMYPVNYSNYNFDAFGNEPTYSLDNQGDYEEFNQERYEDQSLRILKKDTMRLELNKTQLEMKVGDSDTLRLTSLKKASPITWTSSNEAVAMVGSTGVVRAIGEGETYINATVQLTKRDTLSARAFVTVKPVKKPASGKTQVKSTTIDLGFATYEPLPQDGNTGEKNGQPHGNGIMRFKSSHIIPGTQDCVAESGEWVSGMWRDGKINVGTWYRNDGNQVIVKLGQRYN